MAFYENFKSMCETKGLSLGSVCIACGLSESIHSKWKTSIPKSDVIIKLSEYLDVSADYLLFGKERFAPISDDERELLSYYKKLSEHEKIKLLGRAEFLAEQAEEHENRQKQIMVTVNIAEVAAGAGVSIPFTIDNAFAPREFPQNVIPDDIDCGVPINGDSMEPQYPNGCIAWVKCTNTADFGDVVIAVLNGEPYCKIYQQDGLHSYNKNYEIIHVYEQDNFYIFGKVVGNFIE